MSFWVVRFIIEWGIWLIFADKRRWRELLPVSFFAALLGATTDIITYHYPLWQYDHEISAGPNLDNTWSTYVIATYLFIQWLPKQQTFMCLFRYWFTWTSTTIFIEWIHVRTGHMTYPLWWTMYHSYLADWILFWIFFQYHKLFGFACLNRKKGY